MLRRIVIAVVVIVAILGAAIFAARTWLASDDPRERLQRALADALQRDVAIGGLDVQSERVVLTDVSIGNPEGFAGAPLFQARRIELDVALEDLLDDELTGVVTVEAVDLRIAKQGGKTNLLGPLRRSDGGRPLDVHLDLALHSSRLVLEDLDRGQSLVLEGVGMRVLLSNRDGARAGEAQVTVAEVGLHGIPLRDVELVAKANDETVELESLEGRLGEGGRVEGSGRLWLTGDKGWSFAVSAHDVDIDDDVRPLVTALYPPIAATAEAAAVTGKLAASVELSGTGLHWEQVRPTLAGEGKATLSDVVMPAESLVPEIAALFGRDGAVRLAHGAVDFTLADEWIRLTRVTVDREAVRIPVEGGVSLGGALDLRIDVLPLVGVVSAAAKERIGGYASSLPMRIRGTVQKPEIEPPTAGDVTRSLVGGALRRALVGEMGGDGGK